MLKNKQNYLNNPNLPAVDSEFEYTPDKLADLKKCAVNILHFAENFFYIVSLDEGKQTIDLHLCQKRVLRKMRDNRFFILLASRQIGKALALDTKIPTPTGWTTMGDIKQGDKVYGLNGKPCNVVFAHDILENRDCYRVTFDNGQEIIADAEHLWFTETKQERKTQGSVKNTLQIFNTLNAGVEPNHRIPSCVEGVQGVYKELPIDPYVLGVWLGDGSSDGATITIGKRDITEMIDILKNQQTQFNKLTLHEYNADVYTLRISVNENIKTKSLSTLLDNCNLKNNKHIPFEYLLSSRDQRLQLLQGLVDSDGYISKNGLCQFYNTNIELVKQTKQLVESLGYKVTYKEYVPKLYNVECSPAAFITFKPIEYVCRLSFKRNRIQVKPFEVQSKYRAQWHYIKNVEKVESVPVRCITVDSPDSLYLVGDHYIPTHNTTLMTIYALWVACFQKDQSILIVANKEGTAIEIFRRIRLAYEELPNWLKPGVVEYAKTSMALANGCRIGISTTTGTAARGQSINVLILDELAFIESHLVDEFWKSVYPIVSSSKKSKIFIASTANGTGNLFHNLYSGAETGRNGWASDKILWNEIPGRDEKWKIETIATIGSQDAFNQEFNCVTGNTLVDINNNNDHTTATIEQIWNSLETQPRLQTVKNKTGLKVLTPYGYKSFAGIRRQEKECFEILCDTTSLSATADHKIYTDKGNFKTVYEFKPGDCLYVKDGLTKILKITPIGKQHVYDLIDVDGTKSYFTNNILSHNCEFLDSGESSINDSLYEKLSVYIKQPLYVMEEGRYQIWEEPSDNKIYAVGVDVSEGIDKDASVIQVMDISDLTCIKQVACYSNNGISPVNFTSKLHEILSHWGKPLVCIERNNCGAQVVDNLRANFDYDNIVSWGSSTAGREKDVLGIVSHTNTKYTGITNMRYWVNQLEVVQVRDIALLKEFKTFVRHVNGTWSAKKGAGYHDDRVMSMVWSLIILEKGLVDKHFEIIQTDSNGRPLKLKQLDFGIKYFTNPNSFYNDRDGAASAMPSILSDRAQGDDDLASLVAMGYKPLQ